MNEWTTASLTKARREIVIEALGARRMWHAMAAAGFCWRCDAPRRLMRTKLAAARLYKVKQ